MVPSSRDVATGVVNLGNTCYMNAVLQALAHAPELCLAIDCEPHQEHCPIAIANRQRKKKDQENEASNSKEARYAGVDDSDNQSPKSTEMKQDKDADHESTQKSSKTKAGKSKKSKKIGKGKNNQPTLMDIGKTLDSEEEFCVLCEVEKLLNRVHQSGKESFAAVSPSTSPNNPLNANSASTNLGAVAPSAFVHGFITHVAPWFRLGVQEDSHEFLRLLIDAMQKSCISAQKKRKKSQSKKPLNNSDNKKNSKEILSKSSQPKSEGNESHDPSNSSKIGDIDENSEYAFKLFRGKVESIVKCSVCNSVSTKYDPIEDIGLDVTRVQKSSSTSGSSSPVPSALADVSTALERFTQTEKLDAGFKCEKCGSLGKATKQSRLASIPPILSLHLKRFRYGSAIESHGNGLGSTYSGTSSRRRNTSDSSNLTDGGYFGGTSGSAKIEGHVKFQQIFDIRPYLTEELQEKTRNMFCRLFAVIVHAGKNSHSGHYIAFVRNVVKNEWWKMDDARVVRVGKEEVILAEAYMLFYRVVDHPVAKKLQETGREKKAKAAKEAAAEALALAAREEEKFLLENPVEPTNPTDANEANKNESKKDAVSKKKKDKSNTDAERNKKWKRKRQTPKFSSGKAWAKAKTSLSNSTMSSFDRTENLLSENIEFKPQYLRVITEEASSGTKVVSGPSFGVCADDLQGDVDKVRDAITEMLYRLAATQEKETSDLKSIFKKKKIEKVKEVTIKPEPSSLLIVPEVDGSECLL